MGWSDNSLAKTEGKLGEIAGLVKMLIRAQATEDEEIGGVRRVPQREAPGG